MATRKRPTTPEPPALGEVVEYGWHGSDHPDETPGPFEIEVGSPVWERLAEEGKLGPQAEQQVAALKEEQDAQDAELDD